MFLGSKKDLNTSCLGGRGQGGFLVAEYSTACLSEAEGCKICPWGWMSRGTKCFWAADGISTWNESRGDCASRGAELLMPWDQDELVKGPMASGMWDGSRGWWHLVGG